MGIIGDELRSAREKKGLSLIEVEESTKIRVKYLEAIENEEFDIIPGKVYIKGFLKNYAEFLELDSSDMLQLLNELNKENEQENDEDNFIITPTLANNNSFFSNKYTSFLTVILSIVLLSVLVIKFYGSNETNLSEANNLPKSSSSSTNENSSTNPANSVTPKVDGKSKEVNIQKDNDNNNTQAISDASNKEVIIDEVTNRPNESSKVNVVLTAAREDSWALVKVDGIQQFIGIIKKNHQVSFGGKESIYIRLGNAGAIDILYNGNKVEPIGPLHKVSKKTFTVSGIK